MSKKDTKLVKLSQTVREMMEDLDRDGMDEMFFELFNESTSSLTDSRQQKKVTHLLSDVVGIVFFAILCGVDEWIEMEMFAYDHHKTLQKYLKLENGIPSHDTMERVISIIKPDELQNILVDVLKAIIMRSTQEADIPLYSNEELGIEIKDVVAIDGKETRGTGNANAADVADQRNLNELNVQSTEYGITLASKRISEKSNEIPAAQEVLKSLDLKGCVVTADAMNTQKDTVLAICSAHADYCLALKANQGLAYQDVKEYFSSEAILSDLRQGRLTYHKETEELSDKTIIREFYCTEDTGWFADRKLWKNLKSFVYEKKTIIKKWKPNEETVEERFFISSLKADAEMFSIVVRRHWHVENLLHWMLDVTFREDSLRTREKKALHNLGLIRRFTLSILKILKTYYNNISIKHIRNKLDRKFDEQMPVIFSVLKMLYEQGSENQN